MKLSYTPYQPVDYGGKYPTFEKYENATGGALSAYICELSLKGYSDNEIAVLLGVRWSYLFNGLTYYDWSQMVSEYREIQNDRSVSQCN